MMGASALVQALASQPRPTTARSALRVVTAHLSTLVANLHTAPCIMPLVVPTMAPKSKGKVPSSGYACSVFPANYPVHLMSTS